MVVPSYNTRELMEQALRSVEEASEGLDVQVIVVDNASSDGSPEMVESEFPDALLLRSEQNLGFAGANNRAIARARGRHILLLNSDTVVRTDTLCTLTRYLDDHEDVGAVGCRILNPDGSLQLDSRRGFPAPSTAFYKLSGLSRAFPHSHRFGCYNLTFLDPAEPADVDALSGSCMLVRRQVLQEVGGLDDDYFMYGEDLDWCFRMKEAGWRIRYIPDTEIIHFRGESGRAESVRIQFRKNEAMAIFVQKHMRNRYRFFPVAFLHIGILIYGIYSFIGPLARMLALPLLDGVLVFASLWLGVAMRYHPSIVPLIRQVEVSSQAFGLDVNPTRWLTPPPYTEVQWGLVYGVAIGIWLLTFRLLGLYDRRRYSVGWAALAVTVGFAAVVTTVFFFKDYNFSRLAAAAAWACNTLLIAGWRLGVRRLTHSTSGRRLIRSRLLVLGTDELSRHFVQRLLGWGELDRQLVGIVSWHGEERGQEIAGSRVVGLVGELTSLVNKYDIDEVVFSSESIADVLGAVRGSGRALRQLRLRMISPSLVDLPSHAPASVENLPLIDVKVSR
ncbi:MAG: glycosyltransferase [Candidatus Latescibacterota bacterium]|nr:glycosyltransferase [Candidatus Latescibacterota bacterium]